MDLYKLIYVTLFVIDCLYLDQTAGHSPFDCGPLGPPANGGIVLYGTWEWSVATFSCSTGYIMTSGDATRTCISPGIWSGTMPTCTVTDCGTPSSPVNGAVIYSSTTYESTATYICGVGYTMSSGSSTRECSAAGTWTGTQPTCTIIDCGTPSGPANGDVTYSTTTYGSMATWSCSSGYIISWNGTRACGPAGTWSGNAPTCTAVDCGTLSDPMNGDVNTQPSTTFGSTATYSCSVGYNILGNAPRTCASTGTWSGPAPTCIIVDCGVLNNPTCGVVQYPSTTYSSTATYSCFPGATRSGSKQRHCLATGKWSGNQPTCSVTKVISSSVTTSVTEVLYIRPCLCVTNRTFKGLTQEEIIQMLIADTKIEPSSTSQLRRKRECANDSRMSTKTIGWVTSGFFIAIFGLMCSLDLVKICRDATSPSHAGNCRLIELN